MIAAKGPQTETANPIQVGTTITRMIPHNNILPCLGESTNLAGASSNLGISADVPGSASTGTGSAANRNSGGTTTLVWQYWHIMVG